MQLFIYTLFFYQGIISKRLDLDDFILMGNWTITAVYGHQVCLRVCSLET